MFFKTNLHCNLHQSHNTHQTYWFLKNLPLNKKIFIKLNDSTITLSGYCETEHAVDLAIMPGGILSEAEFYSSCAHVCMTYPALATLIDCCSIASWMLMRSCSLMLLNSSMQHKPPSDRTRAPASKCQSPPSFTAATVSPSEQIQLNTVIHKTGYVYMCIVHMYSMYNS